MTINHFKSIDKTT